MKKIFMATSALALMATASFAEEKMQINLCTGGEGKPYNQTGEAIKSFALTSKTININVIATNGTWDNIERTLMTPPTQENIDSGKTCHAYIGQPDGAVVLKRSNVAAANRLKVIGTGPVEYLHVLCSKESGIDDLSDLAGDNTKSVALGTEGSGAWLLWKNFIAEDASYGEVVTTAEEGAIAMASVAANDTTCMLIPSALGSGTVSQADSDFGDSLVLAGANDKDFNDATDIAGKPLYTWHPIPSGTYPMNLQSGWFSSADTIAWQAQIYVNADNFRDNQKALSDLISAVAKAKPAIKKAFGSLD